MADSSPEVVVFDLGRVLVDFDYADAAVALAAESKASLEEVLDLIHHAPMLERLETGRLSPKAFFEEVRQRIGFRGSFEAFVRIFTHIFTPIPAMLEVHAQLRRRGVPLYLLSNTNALQYEYICRTFGFMKHFDGYVVSYRVGVMKPAPGIYEALEQLCGRTGRQLVFFDDRPENVEAAVARGWHGVVHRDPAESRRLLEGWGLLTAEPSAN